MRIHLINITIKKEKEINKNKFIPQDVIKTVNNYTSNYNKYFDYNVIMPKQPKIKINWNYVVIIFIMWRVFVNELQLFGW